MPERVPFNTLGDDKRVVLYTLEFPFPNNTNIYWLGVKEKNHGKGVGTNLVNAAENYCLERGYKSITVETLVKNQQIRIF